jgi:flavin reductase (DIM6/NTAB) family NADH-FMN oxidoreductase RutF
MKRHIALIRVLAVLLMASLSVFVFSEESNKAGTGKQSRVLERFPEGEPFSGGPAKPGEIENLLSKNNPKETFGDAKKSLGARSVLLPTPVWVIGSYDKEGKSNVMTSAWVGICCSKPACVATSLRKATYTFGNIMERKAFTVNIPSESFAEEVAYFGSVSGRDVDKFSTTGLTPVKSDLVDAPYIKEFPLVIECKLLQTIELGSHTMFIGEIMDVKANKTVLGEDGLPDMKKLKPFVFAPGSSGFYRAGKYLGKVSSLAKKVNK